MPAKRLMNKESQKDEPIGLLIGDTRRRIRQVVSSRVRQYRLTTQQFWVVVAIYEHPGFSLGVLATHLEMDDPTASRVVSALAKRKLVQVRDDPTDRRRSRLHLEASGTAMGSELRELATAVRTTAVRGFSSSEINALRASLRKIVANMDRFQDGDGSTAPPGRAR